MVFSSATHTQLLTRSYMRTYVLNQIQSSPFLQSSLAQKVNASDLASLVPQGGSDEGASFMPKLIELQNKLAQTEGVVVAHSQAHPPAFRRLQWWNNEATASDNKADG